MTTWRAALQIFASGKRIPTRLTMTTENTTGSESGRTDRTRPRSWFSRSFFPFQRALVRGLAVVLPPLLTIVLFIWAWNTVDSYILGPVETIARKMIVLSIDSQITDDVAKKAVAAKTARLRADEELGRQVLTTESGQEYVSIRSTWIPVEVYSFVEALPNHAPTLVAPEYFQEYVRHRYLQRRLVLPAFMALFIVILYLIGKLLAVGVGRFFWVAFERLIDRIPIIRNVYSSVKQVTDFAFNESDMKVTRIVAVQYPRIGIWSMGFVTGEGMEAIVQAAGEPMINVLMPTSPMPATGFTICVPKSQTIDLNVTMDQAIQFCVSCGVVVPIQERGDPKTLEATIVDHARPRALK